MALLGSMVLTVFMLLMSVRGEECGRCGETQVPYPLSMDVSCGLQSYKVECKDGKLELPSKDGVGYPIISMDAKNSRMVIMPSDMQGDSCITADMQMGGFYLDDDSPFSISPRNTVMLLNCTERLLLSPLNCTGRSICHSFLDAIEEAKACKGKICCSFLKDTSWTSHRIRVHEGGCTAYTSVVNMDSSVPPSVWPYGIEIQWIPALPPTSS